MNLVECCADNHDFLLISVSTLLFDHFLGFLLFFKQSKEVFVSLTQESTYTLYQDR